MEPFLSTLKMETTDLDNLKIIKVLGKGAMGTVFLVHDNSSDPSARNSFALKVVEKSTMHAKLEADRRARWEITVLTRLSDPKTTHTFLPTLLGSFDTDQFLAFAVPFCHGGDLNVLRHRQTDRVFSPSVIRFYLAEIVCALVHLHGMGIVYRDLKPENVLIRRSGHVTLTDFDLSRNLTHRTVKSLISSDPEPDPSNHKWNITRNITRLVTTWYYTRGLKKGKSARVSPINKRKPSFPSGERSNSFVGTDEYVAPEVINGDGHEYSVDMWALGILAYEMLYGTTPFKGNTRKETFRNVLMKSVVCVGKRTALTDLIERLLEKDPTKRLGYNRGIAEIKEHVFFSGLKWDLLTEVLRPPFIPSREEESLTEDRVSVGDYFQTPLSPLTKRHVSFDEF